MRDSVMMEEDDSVHVHLRFGIIEFRGQGERRRPGFAHEFGVAAELRLDEEVSYARYRVDACTLYIHKNGSKSLSQRNSSGPFPRGAFDLIDFVRIELAAWREFGLDIEPAGKLD